MAERISVTITAQDGASKTFTAIGTSAQKMGDQIEQAGKEGTDGLKTIDTQAKTTGKSIDDVKARATALGAAFGTLVSAAALLGSSYRDQERQIDGINRLYGDQADTILEMSERIQDFTRYSNDAAREGALIASSLATNYDLTADQIGILIERSADLAQIFGTSLPDAIQRTAGAIRGEGEAAERLGLNMSDAAIAARALDAGITNWNVPGALTEAERAAFRFQVFLEDTAETTGAAAEAADNAGGRFRQFANDMQDAGQSIGGFLGPVGEVAAELAPIVIALPVAGAGLGRLTSALAGTAVGARAAALGIGALRIALGPVGLIMTGLVAIGGSLFTSWMNQREAAQDYDASLQSLSQTLERLRRQGDTDLAATAQNLQTLAESFRDVYESTQPSVDDFNFDDPEDSFNAYNEAIRDFNAEFGDLGENITAITNNINDALNDPLIDVDAYLGFLNRWLMAARLMPGTMDDLAITTMLANVELSHFAIANETAADAATGTAESVTNLGLSFSETVAISQAATNASWDYIDSVNGAQSATEDMSKTIAAMNDAEMEFLRNGDNILDFWLQYQENLHAAWNERSALTAQDIDPTRELGAAPDDFVSSTEAAFEATVRLADALDDAGEELDSVLRTYQQIDDLGQRSAASGTIAENLVGTPGEWAEIDELLKSGAITLDEYNAALDAGYRIQESNVRVQEDLNAMRAAQLPLLASEQAAYEAQIDAISQLPPLEQRRALAMQDSAVQAQIAAQYATAYSASLGEIPPEVATNMIVSAAEADPVLKDLLLQFGLIEEGADGTITVNFPDGPTVQQTIQELTASIDALIITMGGVPPLHITADASQANATIDDVQGRMRTLDSTRATPTANLNDNASGALANIAAALAGLDGRTATTYVKTIYTTSGSGLLGDREFAMGGVIPGYADGGVLFRGAEVGPELLHFANGGTAPIMHDGLYTAPPGTYVSPASANPGLGGGGLNVTFTGNFYGSNRAELNEWARNDLLPAFRDEMIRHQMAAGVMPS